MGVSRGFGWARGEAGTRRGRGPSARGTSPAAQKTYKHPPDGRRPGEPSRLAKAPFLEAFC